MASAVEFTAATPYRYVSSGVELRGPVPNMRISRNQQAVRWCFYQGEE